MDGLDTAREDVLERFREQLELDTLERRYEPEKLEELLDNIADMYCCPGAIQIIGQYPQTTQSILSLIRDIHDKLGITVIVITHQMSVVEQICSHVAILDNGEVVEEGLVSEVFAAPKSKAARHLVFPEGYEQGTQISGDNVIRVVFNGAKATNTPLIAQMAIDEGITASILSASTKGIGDKAYGNIILGIPGGADELARAMKYLKAMPDIFVEEVKNDE